MAEPIKFTELTNAGTLDLSAIMAIVQQQGGELVSLQCSMAQVAELVASSAVYADLTTEQKKLIDAINELNAGKQKKLIAGANITINEETGEISSTGGGGGGGDVTKAYVDEQNALQDVEIEKAERDIDLLYKLTQGQSWDFVDQTEHGMNAAPKGTKVQSLLSVEGKSEQKTTTGKNLFDLNDFGNNYETSGTSLVGRYKIEVEAGSTVTLSTDFDLLDDSTTSIFFFENKDDAPTTVGTGVYKYHPRTITTETGVVWIGLYFSSSRETQVTYDKLIEQGVQIQLEIGSAPTTFEPYTGGIPSPNPDYPQEIVSVEELNFEVGNRGYILNNAPFDDVKVIPLKKGMTYYFNSKSNTYAWNAFVFYDGTIKFDSSSQLYNYGRNVKGLSSITDKTEIIGECRLTNNYYKNLNVNYKVLTEGLYLYIAANSSTADPSVVVSHSKDYINEPYLGKTYTITPPHALNKIGDIADLADVVRGVWVKKNKSINIDDIDLTLHSSNAFWKNFEFDDIATILTADTKTLAISNQYHAVAPIDFSKNIVGTMAQYASDIGIRFCNGSTTVKPTGTMIYVSKTPTETAINADDLQFLKSLQKLNEDNVITITDQNENDITYAMKYLIKLSEAI